ncbi:MAG: 1-deoxy-D-xylulose-5-phosphate reductoisomerase [Flavobacteriales bacterium]|mgnify:FL=1|jgi:1-deoxy-D-xylulose-5-phosphate reductoisomerase|nr:1-deoxy-D-xylulose-5-phosphate reductoisomerase [Flavobacteriales bacterium]MDG1174531.1 1-deoxy-D-xylulose-5-phosphate reductoisomerase [Flavobacteriales bacterium]|tara:strand:- start:86 stop:1240 length:1155 start_codon:yes stop_codon:yes gene_type:complete
MSKKGIAILGSTGSIGTQALEVIEQFPDKFELIALTANRNADLLIEQALKYKPNTVVIVDESQYKKVKDVLWEHDIKVYSGEDSLNQVVEMTEIETVLTATVGYSGLLPTINAINAGKNIALANKETLVVAGDIVTKLAQQKGVNIYPVDSEHSAIFQCLAGNFDNKIEKLILTASGGPFRGKTHEELKSVTREQALKHPNWEMGAKITIDSASLMNKGLEVIEAKWLFGIPADKIEVVVHPQSIIHSAVQFEDSSILAQMGIPSMKVPIQYALTYPERPKSNFERFSFFDYPNLTFEKPDIETFKNLKLAFEVLDMGGNSACVLNAANEITNKAFLDGKISFLQIGDINENTIEKSEFIAKPTLEDYIETNKLARKLAEDFCN